MDEMDNILKKVIKNSHPADGAEAGNACISEEGFAEYLNNLLGPSQKEQVEKHLDECEICFQKSIVFSRVMAEMENRKPVDVSHDVIKRAKKLTEEQSFADMIEVVLEFGKDMVNIIRDTAHICSVPEPAALSVRNGWEPARGRAVVQLCKEFHGIRARISVEKTEKNECEIEARISEAVSGEMLNDVRVSLISGKRELASCLTVNGRVSFGNILFETYIIKIYKGKDSAGSIRLKLSSIQ